MSASESLTVRSAEAPESSDHLTVDCDWTDDDRLWIGLRDTGIDGCIDLSRADVETLRDHLTAMLGKDSSPTAGADS